MTPQSSNVVPLHPPTGPEPWMSKARVAAHMGVSVRTITRWMAEGLPHETWGLSTPKFQASVVVRWASQRARRAS